MNIYSISILEKREKNEFWFPPPPKKKKKKNLLSSKKFFFKKNQKNIFLLYKSNYIRIDT